jgi:hypothetical protein
MLKTLPKKQFFFSNFGNNLPVPVSHYNKKKTFVILAALKLFFKSRKCGSAQNGGNNSAVPGIN